MPNCKQWNWNQERVLKSHRVLWLKADLLQTNSIRLATLNIQWEKVNLLWCKNWTKIESNNKFQNMSSFPTTGNCAKFQEMAVSGILQLKCFRKSIGKHNCRRSYTKAVTVSISVSLDIKARGLKLSRKQVVKVFLLCAMNFIIPNATSDGF